MTGKYVPPGRRQKADTQAEAPAPPPQVANDNLRTLEEINLHFWPVKDGVPQLSTDRHELGRTLHGSAITPKKLAFIVLFKGANPRWDSDQIIFTKSRLEILPAALSDGPDKASSGDESKGETAKGASGSSSNQQSENGEASVANPGSSQDGVSSDPIAVFKQIKGSQQGRSFEFDGWYQIDRLTFLEPGSAELVRMLEQKWTRTDRYGNVRQEKRDQKNWEESLSHRWAVLKLKVDETAQKESGNPHIERLPDLGPKEEKLGVNEMLAKLRMGDAKEAQA